MPHSNDTYLATFTYDTAILSSNPDTTYLSKSCQDHLKKLQKWFKLWRIKINEKKLTHVTFTRSLRPTDGLPLLINNNLIPQKYNTK